MGRKMTEEWKSIIGFEHYMISSLGRVKSLDRSIIDKKGIRQRYKGKIRKNVFFSQRRGYYAIIINNGGKQKRFLIHRLMALHFIPNPDNKPCVNHKDGNGMNNRLDNLEWVTVKENSEHAFRNGLMDSIIGSNQHNSKLTEKDIPVIRKMISEGKSCLEIAKTYKVRSTAISKIKRSITWKRVV